MQQRNAKTVRRTVYIPSNIYAALTALAEREHRSANGQIVAAIEQMVAAKKPAAAK